MPDAKTNWVYLARKHGSAYKQLFIKGRNIAARTLYGDYMSEEEPMTLEEIAADRDLPIEMVRFSQARNTQARTFWRSNFSRRPSFFTTM